MAGTRADGIIDESTILSIQYLKNSLFYNPYSIISVSIHDDYVEAQSGIDVKQNIDLANYSHLGSGLYQFVASEVGTAGTYFDRHVYKPTASSANYIAIHSFYVRKESYGSTAPGEIETCRITLNVFDIVANASCRDKVYVEMNEQIAWYGKNLIEKEREMFEIGSDGIVVMNLIETTTLTTDTGTDIYYTINVSNGDYIKKFTVPKGTLDSDLVDLPAYT